MSPFPIPPRQVIPRSLRDRCKASRQRAAAGANRVRDIERDNGRSAPESREPAAVWSRACEACESKVIARGVVGAPRAGADRSAPLVIRRRISRQHGLEAGVPGPKAEIEIFEAEEIRFVEQPNRLEH